MSQITPAELMRRFGLEPDLCILDVRTPAEFDEVRIPRARNVPLDQFNTKARIVRLRLPYDQPLYLVCHSGSRSAIAATKLKRAGLKQTVIVTGGTNSWISEGLPVLRGDPKPKKTISMERQIWMLLGMMVLLGALLSMVHPYFIGLPVLIGAGLLLAGLTDHCGVGLWLSKAPWNQR